MNNDIKVDEKLVEAFHLMYDSFPGVAQLNHKSKLVVFWLPIEGYPDYYVHFASPYKSVSA